MDDKSLIVGFIAGAGSVLVPLLLYGLLRPWRRAWFAHTHVGLMHIVGMRLRGYPPLLLIDALVALRRRGLHELQMIELENIYAANKHDIHDVASLVELAERKRARNHPDKA